LKINKENTVIANKFNASRQKEEKCIAIEKYLKNDLSVKMVIT
jgi:hypothetical protein